MKALFARRTSYPTGARLSILVPALALMLVTTNIEASRFRNIVPIAKPTAAAQLPEGALPVADPRPVARGHVEQAVGDLLANWNQVETENLLDPAFYDASRLSDAMDEKVPRDARMRLLSVQGSQTLEQFELTENGRTIISSVVSVTANTQMEFNDPTLGFRKLEGVNEFVLRIEEEVLP